ncbi:MAG: hypothetical protein IMF01_10160 [Proteobacteria bacterium]|nr:hypothetical protein [Pseudomonadota bacterium]
MNMNVSALSMVLEIMIISKARPGATSLANVAIAVVFLEIRQHKLSIANQVWARV